MRARNTVKPAKSQVGCALGLTRAEEEAAAKVVISHAVSRVGGLNRETAFVVVFIGVMLASSSLSDWLMGRLGFSPPGWLPTVLVGGFVGGTGLLIIRRLLRPRFHAELARRGYNVCPACGEGQPGECV